MGELISVASTVVVGNAELEVVMVRHAEKAARTILLSHEALGSVSYWKAYPQALARATGMDVLLYSRAGHGWSTGALSARTAEAYQREVEVVMPAVLASHGVERPVLYGHSEGGVLSLLYAARFHDVVAVVAESPFIQQHEGAQPMLEGMRAKYAGSDLQRSLAKYHRQPDAVFASFADVPHRFKEGPSPLHAALPGVRCPVLLLQGADDPFGTTPHKETLCRLVPGTRVETIAGVGHLPHREKTGEVLELVGRWLVEVV